jgi:hypothetical protein
LGNRLVANPDRATASIRIKTVNTISMDLCDPAGVRRVAGAAPFFNKEGAKFSLDELGGSPNGRFEDSGGYGGCTVLVRSHAAL